ncbi:MAG TPA: histidine kinase, partial [Chromatiales bacterium]|nr:histidine kinase [Chromatiales bacterium]
MAVTEHDPSLVGEEFPRGSFQQLLDRSSVVRILVAGRLLWPIGILALALTVSLMLASLLYFGVLAGQVAIAALLVGLVVSAITLMVTAERLRRQLLKPLARLEQSVAQVCQGEPGARLPLDEERGVLDTMVRDIDSLSEELTDLYEDMDSRVARQTTRLAQKTGALRILYDIAASINQADDLDVLLLRYMRVMKEMVNGRSATMRLSNPNGRMRLLG